MKSRDGCGEVSRRELALGGLVLAGLLAARGAAIAADPGAAEKAGPAAADVLANLLEGNRRFMDGQPRMRALTARRSALAAGQQPHVVVLACSDSRLSPELIFDHDLGDLFIVRVAGNVTDAVALGSMEYAVDHFPVKVLVVLGHEKCGAVAAAASGEKAHSPNIAALLKKIEPALAPLRSRASGEELVRLGVEANVPQGHCLALPADIDASLAALRSTLRITESDNDRRGRGAYAANARGQRPERERRERAVRCTALGGAPTVAVSRAIRSARNTFSSD